MEMKENIVIINGEKYYCLPEHSYYYPGYEMVVGDYIYNYTYIRKPVPGSTTVYADRYITHIWLRDDVEFDVDSRGHASATWDKYKPDPFINIHEWSRE